MKKIAGIYLLTSPSGKKYVGQSSNIHRRLIEHKSYSKKSKTKLGSSIRKYGFDNFSVDILVECECASGRNILEESYILLLDTIKKGLNHQDGGQNNPSSGFSGFSHSIELKERFSNQRKGIAPLAAISKTSKKVFCDKTNKLYSSISSCAKDLKISQAYASMQANGQRENINGIKFI